MFWQVCTAPARVYDQRRGRDNHRLCSTFLTLDFSVVELVDRVERFDAAYIDIVELTTVFQWFAPNYLDPARPSYELLA
jgi:hypothetical protein